MGLNKAEKQTMDQMASAIISSNETLTLAVRRSMESAVQTFGQRITELEKKVSELQEQVNRLTMENLLQMNKVARSVERQERRSIGGLIARILKAKEIPVTGEAKA